MTSRDDDTYPSGFEEFEELRSAFIRKITLQQFEEQTRDCGVIRQSTCQIPRKLIRFWHDPSELPEDVRACLDSWENLANEGFTFHMFDDISAADYISNAYGERECRAFARCAHPAMRCDYLRMCFILAEGGFYVDADNVLLGEGWKEIFLDSRLKLQPLGYDISAGAMMPAADIWRMDLTSADRIFYVNNDPIAAPPNHPVIRRALQRATEKLLGNDEFLEIQSTTGPGNLTAALAAHARYLERTDLPFDFELLHDWESIAEMRWDLGYRGDSRNWRNVYGC